MKIRRPKRDSNKNSRIVSSRRLLHPLPAEPPFPSLHLTAMASACASTVLQGTRQKVARQAGSNALRAAVPCHAVRRVISSATSAKLNTHKSNEVRWTAFGAGAGRGVVAFPFRCSVALSPAFCSAEQFSAAPLGSSP